MNAKELTLSEEAQTMDVVMSNDTLDTNKYPTFGRWHHGNGVLCCGTVRIARADFDTEPTQKIQDEYFDHICQVLNTYQEDKI
jgi:hypothetical protein